MFCQPFVSYVSPLNGETGPPMPKSLLLTLLIKNCGAEEMAAWLKTVVPYHSNSILIKDWGAIAIVDCMKVVFSSNSRLDKNCGL